MGLFDFLKRKKEINAEERKPMLIVEETIKGKFEDFYKKLKKQSLIIVIIGKRGSGKSALAFKLLEIFKNETKRKCYVFNFPYDLPRGIKDINDINKIAEGSVLLVDEAALSFSARESMKKLNKELSKLMAIARHKDLTLILITQNAAMIDINILRLADTLLLKEPSLLQTAFERKILKEKYKVIKEYFEKVEGNKKSYAYLWDDDFEGFIKFDLPSFWEESLSKAYSGV